MKTFSRLFAFVAMAGMMLTSCEKVEDMFYPSFEKVTLEEREADGVFFARFDVTCAEAAVLKNVTVSYTYGDTTISLPDTEIELTEAKKYEWTLKFNVPTEVAGTRVTKINLTAEVRNGGTKTQSFDTPAAAEQEPDLPTDRELSKPAAFSFTRVGKSPATGDPHMFGLKWTSNDDTRAVSAIIQKDTATKFVQLKSSEWNDIKTYNDLKKAIEEAADMNSFAGVSAYNSADYDFVLGVQDAEVYYMLHITSATVSSASAGTTIVVNGQFCE